MFIVTLVRLVLLVGSVPSSSRYSLFVFRVVRRFIWDSWVFFMLLEYQKKVLVCDKGSVQKWVFQGTCGHLLKQTETKIVTDRWTKGWTRQHGNLIVSSCASDTKKCQGKHHRVCLLLYMYVVVVLQKHMYKYEKLLTNARRPEVLVKEIKVRE